MAIWCARAGRGGRGGGGASRKRAPRSRHHRPPPPLRVSLPFLVATCRCGPSCCGKPGAHVLRTVCATRGGAGNTSERPGQRAFCLYSHVIACFLPLPARCSAGTDLGTDRGRGGGERGEQGGGGGRGGGAAVKAVADEHVGRPQLCRTHWPRGPSTPPLCACLLTQSQSQSLSPQRPLPAQRAKHILALTQAGGRAGSGAKRRADRCDR
eukprot:1559080-Rhodomonas_salina.1